MDQTTRRGFMSRFGAAMAVLGGTEATALAAQAPARSAGAGTFRPARHAQDAWLDQISGNHRIIIDAVTPHGAGEAILFAANLYTTNTEVYKQTDKELAVVICMRHFATPFAFTDAFWAKYGKAVGGAIGFSDPKTKQPPSTNLYDSAAYGMSLPNLGNTLGGVLKHGAQIAICDVATHFVVSVAAPAAGESPDAVYREVKGMGVANSRFVSAGVVAVTRAQEHGYTLIYAG